MGMGMGQQFISMEMEMQRSKQANREQAQRKLSQRKVSQRKYLIRGSILPMIEINVIIAVLQFQQNTCRDISTGAKNTKTLWKLDMKAFQLTGHYA